MRCRFGRCLGSCLGRCLGQGWLIWPQAVSESGGGQLIQFGRGHGVQAAVIAKPLPAQGGEQEVFLVHGLVGAATLQPRRPIRREQQQRNGAVIRLHHGRQQVGHRRARGGDHGRRQAGGAAMAEGKKSGGALIDGRHQGQALPLQQPGRHRQGPGAAAGAEHQLPQAPPHQGLQQGEGSLQVGLGAIQTDMPSRPGWLQDGAPIFSPGP